ncbi:polymeric immunoglobulin receptor-like isoform X2 [Xyrauchen texanus]|uniref:polymeric immunoglobulin receptor-like isoform X2 n=1 Tax=Xyrauchen texanus TaxID=154827 RepID=UPI0022427935|nr:polymeric immunoglobulin receptor-like isoform X2 [Xyrauchen texanus]
MAREETSQLFDMRIVILIFLWLMKGAECKKASEDREFSLQTGGSVTIPCHYDSKYTKHKKFWCYKAKAVFNFCSILAYANDTKGNLSVIDHPDQSLFTVTMRDLQSKDTGFYWCAVEIEGIFLMDEKEMFYMTIQSVRDLSVVNSSVTGQEGGNISVQCFYSSGYKNKLKQWCRYKDERCYTVGKTDTSQNASVQISDDEHKSFSVVMTGLTESDSGWYWCSVGDLQVPVQLTVTVTETKPVVTTEAGYKKETQYGYLVVWLPAVVLLLVIVAAIATVILKKKHNQNKSQVGDNEASNTENWLSSSTLDPWTEVFYRSEITPTATALWPVSVEDSVTYSSELRQVRQRL